MSALQPTVLYIDDDIIALDKPAGLPVHDDGRHARATLVDWLLEHYPDVRGVGEEQQLADGTVIERPGIVHRLDADTSGVIVVARTARAFEALKSQFKHRATQKTYRAFVYGTISDERGIIDRPIGSARGGLGPRSARQPHGTVRDALTVYRVIERGEGFTYVEVLPKTGRTHQIRVHFALIQHPVVADPLYAPGRPTMLGFSRLALHARTLTVAHPDGRPMTFEAPLPADFIEAERRLRPM